ncbi:MAG: hypothetical protein AAF928_07765 [Myxococcota bacterium]
MGVLERPRIDALIDKIADELEGEWLLIGGALVALWLNPRRITEDIDIIGLDDGSSQRWQLLALAEAEHLPIETLNSAADFFVRRIASWREDIEVFRDGRRGRIHRPTPTLFVRLKMARLSEQDLDDCLGLIGRLGRDAVDETVIRAAMASLPPASEPVAARREKLLDALRG